MLLNEFQFQDLIRFLYLFYKMKFCFQFIIVEDFDKLIIINYQVSKNSKVVSNP